MLWLYPNDKLVAEEYGSPSLALMRQILQCYYIKNITFYALNFFSLKQIAIILEPKNSENQPTSCQKMKITNESKCISKIREIENKNYFQEIKTRN